MKTRQLNQTSFVLVTAIVILTSAFSLKGTSAFKVEEVAVLHKNNSAKSRLYEQEKKRAATKRASFIICNDCFWCASQIRAEDKLSKCPRCEKSNLETMPISLDEAYFFHRDESRGIDLLFRKDNDAASGPSPRV